MSSVEESYAILILIAAGGLATVAIFSFYNRDQLGSRGFSLSMIAAAIWSVMLSINIYPTLFVPVHISMTVRNGMILAILLGWLVFVLEYVRREPIRFRPLPVGIVLAIPVLTVIITATNPWHYLAIGPETPIDVGGGPDIDWGPWHLVFMAYAFTISFVAVGFLLRDLRSAHGIHRRQLSFILAGFVIGFVGANDYLFTGAIDGVPAYLRISPFTFLLAAGFWSIALFRHQLFGLVPVSRRTVVKTIPDPVIAVDKNGYIVDVNPAAIELFQPSDDPSGTLLAEFWSTHPELIDAYQSMEQDAEVAIDSVDMDATIYFTVYFERVNSSGEGIIILLRNVTKLKRREKELEQKNRQLDRFTEFVTHDLRNPLYVAQMYLDQAESTNDEEMLTEVRKAHERIDEMISGIRGLSRIDPEQLEPDTIQFNDIVEKAWYSIPTEEATIEIDGSGKLEADKEFLRHLFENLFRNAIEHGDSAVSITVGLQEDGFYVEDDGPGIPADKRDSIFEHGYTTAEEGTGYGLSIVQAVVDVHDWEITVSEGSEGGARISISNVIVVESELFSS